MSTMSFSCLVKTTGNNKIRAGECITMVPVYSAESRHRKSTDTERSNSLPKKFISLNSYSGVNRIALCWTCKLNYVLKLRKKSILMPSDKADTTSLKRP